ncbi:hypothetical protein A8C56_05280 [Niabella ginsenosidivorans]|uniref:RagB/SusD domain-containing protein n=2 Tax=Niabella ginsenosidivorans TaxID=1176587 RepID=A0A1A9I181_9BACT|nr:hypothetical protein A8C56_05280 [Niabella ginsenosidivorans]
MPAIDPSVYNSKDKLRELIRNERRIELAGEGQWYFNIRRWGTAGSVMTSIKDLNNSLVQERIWDNKYTLMPYPQTAVDRNSNLKNAQASKGY